MHSNKQLYKFLIKALFLYVLWNVIYHSWISKDTKVEEKMTSSIALVSSRIMNWWGYNMQYKDYYENNHFEYSEIKYNNKPLVLIANPCNGLNLIMLFIGFIIAYPGNWRLKGVYIFFGSILICLINLIRVQILLLNSIHYQSSFEFNHKYTYTVAVYLCVFALWMIWANRFSNRKNLLILNKVASKTY
ncbi:exosortase family protein XrtF [Rhodocytophaga rosea]|uniref:Exosortase family protein XrtF n=1 Tax=Rhodocytophaga rosea TaxID=2704465 RepID=A0A6C0GCR6_9BACT|nr:exosortase family protein XrtF [Rhodocytophaga rosea]